MTDFILIGCGLPRTGTHSTKVALDMILPGKCYHMYHTLGHETEWKNILNEDMTDEEFCNFFISNGFVAGIDAPFCLVYQRAMRLFPNAKCFLTERDPESWAKSFKSTICAAELVNNEFPYNLFTYLKCFHHFLKYRPWLRDPTLKIDKFVTMTKAVNDGKGVEYYNQWVADVKETVPKERLLVYSVKEGWEPLCKFLNVGIPDEPFPFTNESASFGPYIRMKRNRSWLLLYEVVSLPIIIGALHFLRS